MHVKLLRTTLCKVIIKEKIRRVKFYCQIVTEITKVTN